MTLVHLLKSLGSQEEAAERIGVAQTTISAWLTGKALPRRLAVRALAQATGRTVGDVSAIVAAERAAVEAARAARAAAPAAAPVGPVAEGA